MNEHVTDFVDLYLDGEMEESQIRRVESHLRDCEVCAQFYTSRRRLSAVVQELPSFTGGVSDREFAARIVSKLEPRAPSSQGWRLSDLSWLAIPILLVIGLAFIQTVWVESSLVQFVPQVEDAFQPGQYLLPFSFALPAVINDFIKFLLDQQLLAWSGLSAVAFSAALSMLYVSWLAGWWVRGQKRNNKYHSEMEFSNEPSSNS